MGLLSEDVDATDEETTINAQFEQALSSIVFLPFGYLVDKYRWDLYSANAKETDMNCHWVKLRMDIQGVAPPSKRCEKGFDAGSKYHVAANVGYVRYFTARIYEYQFYKAMCLAAGEYVPGNPDKPLHRCNFYGSKAAGKKLQSMLRLGSSRPWKEAIEVITGEPRMDTSALREYFAPLEKWLMEENKKNGVHVGWEFTNFDEYCSKSEEDKAREFIERAEKESEEIAQQYVVISWAYNTNITDENEKKKKEFQVRTLILVVLLC